MQMIWAAEAVQSGRPGAARNYLRFPAEAANDRQPDHPHAIHPWELETIVGELLETPKARLYPGVNHVADCSTYGTVRAVVNFTRRLEDAEAGMHLADNNIFSEMHRIGHRQFPWQRGYLNLPQFYRYSYIYGQGACGEYFARSYGLTVSHFSLAGLSLYAAFAARPSLVPPYGLERVGVTQAVLERALVLLCNDVEAARRTLVRRLQEAGNVGVIRLGYKPSVLRQFPVLRFEDRLRAPLRDLLLTRITSGVYYDLIGAGGGLLNDAAYRFEEYSRRLMVASLPALRVAGNEVYQVNGNAMDGPDAVLRLEDDAVGLVVECKATKLTHVAQYAEKPAVSAERAYDEMAKGVFQIWRYFSHVRRGVVPGTVAPTALGMLLPLDTWFSMSADLRDHVTQRAHTRADAYGGIAAADRRSVVFVHIQDLETVLLRGQPAAFIGTLAAACEPRFRGYDFLGVFQAIQPDAGVARRFPFPLAEVLPWWAEFARGRADVPAAI